LSIDTVKRQALVLGITLLQWLRMYQNPADGDDILKSEGRNHRFANCSHVRRLEGGGDLEGSPLERKQTRMKSCGFKGSQVDAYDNSMFLVLCPKWSNLQCGRIPNVLHPYQLCISVMIRELM
jgi:hypothetical protein